MNSNLKTVRPTLVAAAVASTLALCSPSAFAAQSLVKGTVGGAYFTPPVFADTAAASSGSSSVASVYQAAKVCFDLNDNGELKHVSDEFVADQLVDAKLNPDGLLISVKDPNTQEVFRYRMKLSSDATTAEIKMIAMNMPPGMPKAKPWKVMKVIK